MDFAGIGKIGAFAKQKNLMFAANYRMKTGQSIVDSNGRLTLSRATMFNSVQSSKSNSVSAVDKAKMASIKQKLKSGKKISDAELSYLKEKDPSLYKKAKYANDAREELKSELQSAKTKQEAREAVMRAMAKIAADCSADFEGLKGGVGGGGASMNFGGDVNLGGDMNIDAGMSVESADIDVDASTNVDANIEVAGAENISANETSNITNSENLNAEENSFAQDSTSPANNDDSDSAMDILDKYIYAIRAVQNEWMEFMKSDRYKDMPEDIFEAAGITPSKKPNKISNVQLIDAMMAYQKSMSYGLEE